MSSANLRSLYAAKNLAVAAAKASVVSSLGFWLGYLVFLIVQGEVPGDSLWVVFARTATYSLVSLPFFAFGICVLGLPVAHFAHRVSQWVGWSVIAIAMGTISGTIILNSVSAGGLPTWTSISAWFSILGLATGGWAGLVFWWFARSASSRNLAIDY